MARQTYPFRNLVFEGGGVLGVAYAGALEVLEEEGILEPIQNVAGTSVGAITSLAVALRYNSKQVRDILTNLDFESFLDEPDPVRLPTKYGWYNTKPISDWLEKLIKSAGSNLPDSPELTGLESFADLKKLGARNLRVFATDLNIRQAVEFSVEQTPKICVRDAILASIAIPLFFQAFQFPNAGMQNHIFVDGGLIINYPIITFDDESANRETLGFRFERRQKYASNNLKFGQMRNWAQNIFEIAKNIQSEYLRHHEEHLKRTVSIDVDSVSVTDFDLNSGDRDWLMENGRRATQFYLQRFRNQSRLRYKFLHMFHLVR